MVSHAHPSARQLRVDSAQATLGPLAVWSQIQAKPLKPSSAWMLPFPESWAACCLVAQLCPVARQVPLSMGILQVRTQEWIAMPSSKGSS